VQEQEKCSSNQKAKINYPEFSAGKKEYYSITI